MNVALLANEKFPMPAILFFRQAPYAPEHPADLALALLSEPHLAEGCMVVVGERNIRRKHFPLVSNV